MKLDPLHVEIVGDRLVISIGISTLCFTVARQDAFDEEPLFKVIDEDVFAEEIATALCREEEDGSTKVTRMLDAAAVAAWENGAEGLEYNDA